MALGIAADGDRVDWQIVTRKWRRDYDVAVFYGLEPPIPELFEYYRAAGRAVYVDLGYWGRREGGRWTGYHKVCVNARHPTAYFRKPQHALDRLSELRVQIKPMAPRDAEPWKHILLAGMGDKGAAAEGYRPEEWERWAIDRIRQLTDRPILYRPKPSWKQARPIKGPGMRFSGRERDVSLELVNCWAVVTHHSNVAVDAAVAGIPTFCWGGVAAAISRSDLVEIETPVAHPMGVRQDWAADLAYTQWSVKEIASGACWRHLKSDGLL